MAVRRQAVRPEIEGEKIRPSASPVDTFVRPAVDQEKVDVAKALGDLSPTLGRMAAEQAKDEAESAAAAGAALAREHDKDGITPKQYGEMVKAGKIDRAQNPFFAAGYRRQSGILSAYRLYGEFQQKLAKDPRAQTGSLQAFDAIYKETVDAFVKESVGMRDQAFESGFQEFDRLLMGERNEYVNRVRSAVKQDADNGRYLIASNVLQDKGLDADMKAAKLQEELANVYTTDPTSIGATADQFIKAIGDTAVLSGDPELAKKLLEGVTTGGTALIRRAAAQEMLQDLPRRIAAYNENQMRSKNSAEDLEREKTIYGFAADANRLLMDYRNGTSTEFSLAPLYTRLQSEVKDPETYVKVSEYLEGISNKAQRGAGKEDDTEVRRLKAWANDPSNGKTGEEVRAELRRRLLLPYGAGGIDVATYNDIDNDLKQTESKYGTVTEFFQQVRASAGWSQYGMLMENLRNLSDKYGNRIYLPGEAVAEANQYFTLAYSEWMKLNPNATMSEQVMMGTKFGNEAQEHAFRVAARLGQRGLDKALDSQAAEQKQAAMTTAAKQYVKEANDAIKAGKSPPLPPKSLADYAKQQFPNGGVLDAIDQLAK